MWFQYPHTLSKVQKMKFSISLLLLSITTLKVFTLNITLGNFELSYENKNLINAFKKIRPVVIETFSSKGFNLISVNNPKAKDIHDAVKSEIMKFVFQNESIGNSINDQYKYAVMLIDDISVFRAKKMYVDANKFKYSGFHLAILLEGNFTHIHEIFDTFWTRNIYNIMILSNVNGISLFSFYPFENPNKCGDTSPKIVSQFLDGEFTQTFSLRKKFNNMNLCPVTVTSFTEGIAFFKTTFMDGSFTYGGYEFKLIKTIAKLLNFTLDLRFHDGFRQWGRVFTNGTITGLLRELKDKRTEIVIGSYFIRDELLEVFDSSTPYLNIIVFLIISPAKKLSGFEKLLSPFQSIVWIVLLLTFLFGVAVILIIEFKFKNQRSFFYGERVNEPITNMFLALIGLPLVVLPKRNFSRFLLMMFLLLTLVLRSAYQGSLYKFLQSDGRHKNPQNIRELIERKYTFILSEVNRNLLMKYHPQIHKMAQYNDNYRFEDIDKLIQASQRSAVFSSRIQLINYSQNHTKFPYEICNENFFTVNVVMYFNKNFFLKKAIDSAIQDILTMGFMKKWLNEYDKTKKWKKDIFKPNIMNFEHLSGAFYFLIIGHFVSVIILGVEVVVYKIVI